MPSMKEKFAKGELVLCMNLRLARTVDIAMVAKAGGYDALYVDMQHAPYSIETTSTICAASIGDRHHPAGAGAGARQRAVDGAGARRRRAGRHRAGCRHRARRPRRSSRPAASRRWARAR